MSITPGFTLVEIREKGISFEKLVQFYLTTDPVWTGEFKNVWLGKTGRAGTVPGPVSGHNGRLCRFGEVVGQGSRAVEDGAECCRVVECSGEHDGTLDCGEDPERGLGCGIYPGNTESAGELSRPVGEIPLHAFGEPVTFLPECECAGKTHALPGLEVPLDRVEHRGHTRQRVLTPCVAGISKRLEYLVQEPGIDVFEHGDCHLLLPAGEEVVQAPSSQPGRFLENPHARPLVSVLTERLCDGGDDSSASGGQSGHVLRAPERTARGARWGVLRAATETGGRPP